MNKYAIVNLATDKYILGQQRLRQSLIDNKFNGDFYGYIGEDSVGSPKHSINPYAFKVYAINKVKEMGYKQILWLDASVYAIKKIDFIWEIIETKGFLMQNAGHFVGTWSNDKCLDYFNLSRNDAISMPMYGNAGLLGLNFNNEKAIDFFNKWHKASEDGIFVGDWNNNNFSESDDLRCKGHRHDMSAGSIIANKLGLDKEYISSTEILQYASPEDKALNETIVFKAQGIS